MLNANTLKYLTDEMKHQLSQYEETYESEGWKLILEWAARSAEEAKTRAFTASTWEEAVAWRGKWHAYNEIIGMQESTYNELEAYALEQQQQEIEAASFEMP